MLLYYILCLNGSAQFDNALQVMYKITKKSLLLCSSMTLCIVPHLSMQILSRNENREDIEKVFAISLELVSPRSLFGASPLSNFCSRQRHWRHERRKNTLYCYMTSIFPVAFIKAQRLCCTLSLVTISLLKYELSNQLQDKTFHQECSCRWAETDDVLVGWGMLIPSDRLGLFATCIIPSILKLCFE